MTALVGCGWMLMLLFFFITAAMNWIIKYYGNVLLLLSTVSVTAALVGYGWLLMLLFFQLLQL